MLFQRAWMPLKDDKTMIGTQGTPIECVRHHSNKVPKLPIY